MNYFAFSFLSYIIVPYTISLGNCDDFSYSICWKTSNNAFDRSDGLWNIWLNSTTMKSIQKQGKFTSLTVSPTVENKLTLQHGDKILKWTFTINPRTNSLQITGQQKPQHHLIDTTQEALNLLSPSEVFACEEGTLFLHQDQNLILAIGYTLRFPIKLESRSPSMLLISWMEDPPTAPDPTRIHSVSLYHTERSSYTAQSADTTADNYYRFTPLESCTPYVACVEMAGTHSLACLSSITDPDVPRHFQVTSWNSTSLTVAWDCPLNRKYSLFLLTAFYLNSMDDVIEETLFWHQDDRFVFTLSNMGPCSRVKFGLQTVCQDGIDSRFSKMLLINGNSVNSNIKDLHQTSSGPNNYTLTWEVQNTSSISMFRVYHQGALQGSTLITNHTVDNLQPCQEYQAKVEALCGESVVMSTETVTAHTGPVGVSDLQFHSQDSTALWTPGTTDRPGVSFLYELSYENGTTIQRGHLTEPALHLPELGEGMTYALNVWEQCEGEQQSEHALVCFDGVNAPLILSVRSLDELDHLLVEYDDEQVVLEFDYSGPALALVVPWSLTGALQDPGLQLKARLELIIQNKLEELMKGFQRPVRIKLITFEPLAEERKTKILFQSFDGSITDVDLPLPIEDLLTHVQSLRSANITVKDEVIYWNGLDNCVSPKKIQCPSNSLCINTLDSYTCVCQHGYYDVGFAIMSPVDLASRPVCNENGLFSQCLAKLMAGGIAKAYLIGYFKGKVEVVLNDGQCSVKENETFYYFHTSRKASQCGTRRQANKTHIEFQNTLSVTLSRDQSITRRDLTVVWKCVYPRSYVSNTQVNVDLEWINSYSLVEYNSSLELGLTMALYNDKSYTYSYNYPVEIELQDTLFFQVALQTSNTFISEVLLEVVSCWATETADPQHPVQGLFLQDGCPVDNTFHWLSANGVAQKSLFSIQMFTMPKGVPIYFHCLARICGHDEDCTRNCTTQRLSKRSVSSRDVNGKQEAVVSAGPLLVKTKAKSGTQLSNWAEHVTMLFIVAGSIGLLGLTVLSVSATKAIMSYYERQRLQ